MTVGEALSTQWSGSAVSAPPPSAVDVDGLAGDEGGVIAGEERDGADEILRHLAALDRLHGGDGGEFLLHAGESGARRARERAGRARQAGRDRVHGDAVRAEL